MVDPEDRGPEFLKPNPKNEVQGISGLVDGGFNVEHPGAHCDIYGILILGESDDNAGGLLYACQYQVGVFRGVPLDIKDITHFFAQFDPLCILLYQHLPFLVRYEFLEHVAAGFPPTADNVVI